MSPSSLLPKVGDTVKVPQEVLDLYKSDLGLQDGEMIVYCRACNGFRTVFLHGTIEGNVVANCPCCIARDTKLRIVSGRVVTEEELELPLEELSEQSRQATE